MTLPRPVRFPNPSSRLKNATTGARAACDSGQDAPGVAR